MATKSITLRLRVLRLKGSEHRMVDSVYVSAGGVPVRVSASGMEWIVYDLESLADEISFTAGSENASCLCGELDGRKRIVFSPHLCMLVEGYHSMKQDVLSKRVSDRVSLSKTTSRNCEIVFPSTQGMPSERPEPVASSFHLVTPASTIPASPKFGPEAPKDVVDIALDWIDPKWCVVPDSTPVPLWKYSPPVDPERRVKWTKEVTAMSSKSPLASTLRAVDFSQKLDEYFIL